MSVIILNYGLGNLNSILNMTTRLGIDAKISNEPSDLTKATKIILPGVGAFDHGINGLKKGDWLGTLNEVVLKKKVPILGVCLGMQLMCNKSEEGYQEGLGWINADVCKFKYSVESNLKIPHMGWNTVAIKKNNPLIDFKETDKRFYFVHSYYVACKNQDDIFATANYGHDFTAAFSHENIYGVQFHPEKSHRFGMDLFQNFLSL